MTSQIKICIAGYFSDEELSLIPFVKQLGFTNLLITSSVEDGPMIIGYKERPTTIDEKDFNEISTNLLVKLFKHIAKPRTIFVDYNSSNIDNYAVYKRSELLEYIYD